METSTTLLRHYLAQYDPIHQTAWQALQSHLHRVSWKKGYTITLKPKGLYFLAKGLVKESVDWQGEGEATILRLIPEGTTIFAPSTIFGRYYTALEDCKLLELSWRSALILSLQHPALDGHYNQLLSEWLQLLPDRVDLVHMPRHQRKKQFLLKHPSLKERVPQVDLANYLAIRHDFAVC